MAKPIKTLVKEGSISIELWQKENGEKYVFVVDEDKSSIHSVNNFLLLERAYGNAKRTLLKSS